MGTRQKQRGRTGEPPEVQAAQINRRTAVIVAIITFVTSLTAGFLSGRASEAPSAGPETPEQPSVVKIRDPDPDTKAPWCTKVQGSATIPRGKALVVAVWEDQDPRYYFEGTVRWDAGDWSATINLGDEKNLAHIGHDFFIYAIVIDKDIADYLSSTNKPGATWWSSPTNKGWPPTSEEKAQVTVNRSAERGNCANS